MFILHKKIMVRFNWFPTELIEAVTYLNTLIIKIAEEHEDGRVNSIADEDTIIDLLIKKYGDAIEKPVAREWWDVKIFGYECV